MAPEQFLGDLDKAIDQYALAIMAYEWLTGYPPFIIRGAIDPISAFLTFCNLHTNMPVPPLHDKRSDIPSQVEAVLMKALAKKPEERFGSVREFAQVLEVAYSLPPLLGVVSTKRYYPIDTPLSVLKPQDGSDLCIIYFYNKNEARAQGYSAAE